MAKSNVLQMPAVRKPDGPQPPESTPNVSCSPCVYMLDLHRDNILTAIRRGRSYRSVAAQYGISALDVWKIVTEAYIRLEKRAA